MSKLLEYSTKYYMQESSPTLPPPSLSQDPSSIPNPPYCQAQGEGMCLVCYSVINTTITL